MKNNDKNTVDIDALEKKLDGYLFTLLQGTLVFCMFLVTSAIIVKLFN
jgi:hypothetical protein